MASHQVRADAGGTNTRAEHSYREFDLTFGARRIENVANVEKSSEPTEDLQSFPAFAFSDHTVE